MNLSFYADARTMGAQTPDAFYQGVKTLGITSVALRAGTPPPSKGIAISLYDTAIALDDPDFFALFSSGIARALCLGAQSVMVGVGAAMDGGVSRDEEDEKTVRLAAFANACRTAGLAACLYTRRPFAAGKWVCWQKVLRAAERAGTSIVLDAGASHAVNHSLEDLFALLPHLGAMTLNDNMGFRAARPRPGEEDGDTERRVYPDDLRQPGYGNAPYARIGEVLRAKRPELPLYINGAPYQNAEPETVWLETRVLLSGKVLTHPTAGTIGRDARTGRLLI